MTNTVVTREKLFVTEKNDLEFIMPNRFQRKFFGEQSDGCEDARVREVTKLFCIRKYLLFLQEVEGEGRDKEQCCEI